MRRWRRICGRVLSALAAVLVLLWIAGNLLVDVQSGTPRFYREEAFATLEPARTLRDAFDHLPSAGVGTSRIELLDRNPEAWAARWRLLGEARTRLEVSYFILDPDIFGISFLGHLLHKAREGVRVRVLLDAIGTSLSREIRGNDFLDSLAAVPNVAVKVYRPYAFRIRDVFLTLNPLAFLASDHDKILIADGARSLIGGRNIAREYLAGPGDYARSFRDTDVVLQGRAVTSALEAVFNRGFESAKSHDVTSDMVDLNDPAEDLLLAYEAMDAWVRGVPVPAKTASAIRKNNLSWLHDLEKLPGVKGVLKEEGSGRIRGEVRLLDSSPRILRSEDPISRSFEQIVRQARTEIFIQNPYVVLSREAVAVLEEAAARGVRITIFTNSPLSSDNALSQAFFLEQWPRLLARIPTLRLFVAGDSHNIHGKLAGIDDQLALIGTYNLDPLSMAFNGELVAAVWSAEFTRQLLETPRRLIAGGRPGVFEYRIRRNRDGSALLDKDGNPVIAFGQMDHTSPDQWKRVQWYRDMLRIAVVLPAAERLLWK